MAPGHRRRRCTRRRGGWCRRTCGPGTPWCWPPRPPASRSSRPPRALGVEHVLVTPVEFEDGLCTGRPGGPPLWRAGKAAAVRAFGAAARPRPDQQLRLLQRRPRTCRSWRTVGRARALNPEPGLAAAAAEQGLADRPVPLRAAGPGCGELARTAGARRRHARRLRRRPGAGRGQRADRRGHPPRRRRPRPRPWAASWAPRWAGSRLDVRGAEHLADPARGVPVQPPEPARRAGPGQAAAPRVHRGGQEGGRPNIPGFGLAFRLADVAFVDRGNTDLGEGRAGARGAAAARGGVAGHRPGGHPLGHPGAGPVQEGRVPRRDAGRRARSCRSSSATPAS